MLPSANRMRSSADFRLVTRSRHRARRGPLVVYLQPRPTADRAPQVGLIVGKSVGGSVVRHRVSRRLRAQLAARLDRLPDGCAAVVRALPDSRDATSEALGTALESALSAALDSFERTPARASRDRADAVVSRQ